MTPPSERGKRAAAVLSAAAVAVVLSPIVENWRKPPHDGFPLSYYPMFSHRRSPVTSPKYIVGFDGAGERYVLPFADFAPGGMNQVRKNLSKVTNAGEAHRLCEQVADQVAGRDDEPYRRVVWLQIVEGWYDMAAYFAGDKTPQREQSYAFCFVERVAS